MEFFFGKPTEVVAAFAICRRNVSHCLSPPSRRGSAPCSIQCASDDRSKVHVGVIYDVGGKDDRSFNGAAWQGASRAAKEFPLVLRDVDPGDPTSMEPAVRAFAVTSLCASGDWGKN